MEVAPIRRQGLDLEFPELGRKAATRKKARGASWGGGCGGVFRGWGGGVFLVSGFGGGGGGLGVWGVGVGGRVFWRGEGKSGPRLLLEF